MVRARIHSFSIRTAILLLGTAPLAFAEASVELGYDAVADCPQELDFRAAVASRGGHFDAKADLVRRTFTVTVRKGDGGYIGNVQIRHHDVASAPREVQGSTCSEVVDALAVVTAIELRPASDEAPTDSEASTPERPMSLKQAEPENAPFTFKGRSSWGGAEVGVNAGTLLFKPLLSLSLSFGAVVGPFPKMFLPRYDFIARLAHSVTTPAGDQRLNGPILRFRASAIGGFAASSRQVGDETVSVNPGASVGLGACWSPHYDNFGWVLLGCVELGYGMMGLTTRDADGHQNPYEMVGFGTGGPLVELEYNIGRLFHVGMRAGAEALSGPLSARRADGSRILESRMGDVYGAIGVGAHF